MTVPHPLTQEAIQLAKDGVTGCEIARRLGMRGSSLRRIFKRHDIKPASGRNGPRVGLVRAEPTQEWARKLFDYLPDGRLVRKTNRRGFCGPGSVVGGDDPQCRYLRVLFAGKTRMVHQVIWLWHYGTLPPLIDHKNGNPTDNRIENLREATPTQNGWNIRVILGAVKYKGVSFDRQLGAFRAGITVNKRYSYLGAFDDPKDAARAYDKAAIELFGEFAATNRDLGLI